MVESEGHSSGASHLGSDLADKSVKLRTVPTGAGKKGHKEPVSPYFRFSSSRGFLLRFRSAVALSLIGGRWTVDGQRCFEQRSAFPDEPIFQRKRSAPLKRGFMSKC